jgi:hypothetical protein
MRKVYPQAPWDKIVYNLVRRVEKGKQVYKQAISRMLRIVYVTANIG